MLNQVEALAGATERDDYMSTSAFGDQALAITFNPGSYNKNASYVFSSYNDKDTANPIVSASVELSSAQTEGDWHWLYFAYDKS